MMSVSGHEQRELKKIKALFGDGFDEIIADAPGNIMLVKKCGRENAPKILVDTHFDEIGFFVSGIYEGGFLSFVPIGGVDPAILQACDVIVYGEKEIRGVVTSTPPHLAKKENKDKYPDTDKLYIDTGYSEDEIKKLVKIGTPVGFAPVWTELAGGRLAGKSFDNKACAACALFAVMSVPKCELAGDVFVLLSCFEETARGGGGVTAGAFGIYPDYALVIDVNLAKVPDVPERETVPMGEGVSVSLSAVTDRKLTARVIEMCEKEKIRFTKCVSASSTGTNAVPLNLVGEGIPVCDVGLPLKGMHTFGETIDLGDANELVRLVSAFLRSEKIAEEFKK